MINNKLEALKYLQDCDRLYCKNSKTVQKIDQMLFDLAVAHLASAIGTFKHLRGSVWTAEWLYHVADQTAAPDDDPS